MEPRNPVAYRALLVLSAVFAAGAVATLVPWPGASWDNVLGYRSLCTFAPMATAICALLAAVTCSIRARLYGPHSGDRRSWAALIIVAILLLAVVAAFLPSYIVIKLDVGSGASPLVR